MTPPSSRVWLWTPAGFSRLDGLPAWDRGFRYGMAVFESIRCSPGRLWFWEEHAAKLAQTAERLKWPLPHGALSRAAALLQEQAPPAPFEGFARLYLTAGDGAPTAPVETPRLLLFFEPRTRSLPQTYHLVESPAPHQPVLPGAKAAAYWNHIRALEDAQRRGAHETLLFNADGHLVGAAMANVFISKNGRWMTPAASTGTREGVVRDWVIQNHPTAEAHLSRKDCREADALFLTSSWLGILPVASVEGINKPLPQEVSSLRKQLEDSPLPFSSSPRVYSGQS